MSIYYNELLQYTKEGLRTLLSKVEIQARMDFINNLTDTHKAKLQAECSHTGRYYEKIPYACYHVIYCAECGKKIREYDSSG